MISNLPSTVSLIVPMIYWAISIVWLAIFVLLLRRLNSTFRKNRLLTLLILVLAIDAMRTVVESLYFGSLFSSYFKFLQPSVQAYLESPLLLSVPKVINLISGCLVLFLIVGRWLPLAQSREDEAIRSDLEKFTAFAREADKQRKSLIIAQSVANVGSWETDLNTLQVEWSDQTFRIFETNPGTFVPTHQRFLELVHPDDRAAVDAAFRNSTDSREVSEIEHRISMPDGRIKCVIERWQVLVDATGFPRAMGTCQDITELRRAQSKATEALELLSVASRAARLGGWSFNVATKRLSWSIETKAIHEVPDDYVPALNAGMDFYAPEFRSRIETAFNDCLENGNSFAEILQMITAKGNRVWVKAIGVANFDRDGRTIAVHGAIQDISEQVKREENLKLLENAIARLNDIVIITDSVVDSPGPHIIMVNDAFQKITQYTADEVIGKSPRFLQGPKTQRAVLDQIRHSIAKGKTFRGEFVNYAKDGQEILLEIEILPITDSRGRVSNFVAIERDLTERRKLERERADISQRLETMIQELKIGIFVHRNFKPLIVNQELARMLGYPSPSDLLRLGDIRLFYADDERARIENSYESHMRGESTAELLEIKGKRRDSSMVQLEHRAFVVTWGDENALCVILADVTVQKQLEEQLRQAQRLEIVGQLTGGVAHDFNNILTVILGNAEFLEEGLADNAKLREHAKLVRKAANRGADLTGRLLSFARRQPLDPKAVDVSNLLNEMRGLLARTLGEQIQINVFSNSAIWPVQIDSGQLENAILNLVLNARDAMPNGGALTVELENKVLDSQYTNEKLELNPGQYVKIEVSDTGIGMTQETISKAFEPFFTTKDVGKGTGLGLSMVYGFVKQSGGHISISSEIGKGTTVKLYVPKAVQDVEVTETAEIKKTSMPTNLPTRKHKILVVEDDELVRNYVESQLKVLGYNVVCVSDGVEASEVLRSVTDFNLLLTDVVLPKGIGGPQLAKIARDLYPHLAVLFTSGYTENAIVHHGRLDEGTLLLSKPYRRAELAKKVRMAIDKK